MKKLATLLSTLFIIYYKMIYGKKVEFGKNIIVNHKLKIKGPGKLIIANNVNLWAYEEPNRFYFYDQKALIKIGANCRLNGLTCHSEESSEIGDNCLTGSTIIMDTDFHTFSDREHILYNNPKTKPVRIGNGVWICGQSVILKGCQIGNKTVIGFRSVVTKNFPSNVVVAGNPAKIVKSK